MTAYQFSCIAPFFVWCLIGAVVMWFNGIQ